MNDNINFKLNIYTWPAMRGAPVGLRYSYHATTTDAIAHLDAQTEAYCYAVLSRILPCVGYMPCDWQGRWVGDGERWPQRRGANGEHPAYLAYLADRANLIAEVRAIHARDGGGTLNIAGKLLSERHPLITAAEEIGWEAASA